MTTGSSSSTNAALSSTPPFSMQPSPLSVRHIFGIKGDVKSTIHWLDEHELIFPVGANVVLHQQEKRSQRFLPLTQTNIQALPSSASTPQSPTHITNTDNDANTASDIPFLSALDTTTPSIITCLTLSIPKHSHAKGKLLAIAETRTRNSEAVHSITVYDMATMKRRGRAPLIINSDTNTNTDGTGGSTGSVVSLAFSPDSKFLLSLTGKPNPTLTLWAWDKGKSITSVIVPVPQTSSFFITQSQSQSQAQAQAQHQQSLLDCHLSTSFCPTDPSVLCLIGPSLLRFLHIEQQEFRSIPYTMKRANANSGVDESMHDSYTCHVWLDDRLIIGTVTGMLHLFENGEYRGLIATSPALAPPAIASLSFLGHASAKLSITSLASLSKGFVCGCTSGVMLLYERDEKEIYRQSRCWQIENENDCEKSVGDTGNDNDIDTDSDEADTTSTIIDAFDLGRRSHYVSHIAISPSEDSACIALSSNQCYMLPLTGTVNDGISLSALAAISKRTKAERDRVEDAMLSGAANSSAKSNGLNGTGANSGFDCLSLSHGACINGIDRSVRKPLLVTCSDDRTVKLWNYQSLALESTASFPSIPKSCTIHPSGYYICLTFSDCIKLCSLHIDGLKLYKTFNLQNPSLIQFSNGGQYFVATSSNISYIYSTFTCSLLSTINCHKGSILALTFNEDDSAIITASSDGTIYQSKIHGEMDGQAKLLAKLKSPVIDIVMVGEHVYAACQDRTVKFIPGHNTTTNANTGSSGSGSGSGNSHSQSSISEVLLSDDITCMALVAEPYQHLTPLLGISSAAFTSQTAPPATANTNNSATSTNSGSGAGTNSVIHRTHWLVVGTSVGNLILLPLPFTGTNTNNHNKSKIFIRSCFSSAVSAITLTLDQASVIACGDDGSMAVVDIDSNNSLTSSINRSKLLSKTSSSLTSGSNINNSNHFLFSEENLISASHLITQNSLLQKLQHTIVKLNGSHEHQLYQLEENYKQKLSELSARYESEILYDKKQYKLLEENKMQLELRFTSREGEIRELFQTKKMELFENHEIKVQIERERMQELKAKFEQEMELLAGREHHLSSNYQRQKRELVARMETTIAEEETRWNHLVGEKTALISEFEAHSREQECDIDDECLEWKHHYNALLLAEKQSSQFLKSQHAEIRAQFLQQKNELVHLQNLLVKNQKHYYYLTNQLQNLNLSLASLEKENAERSHTIGDKQLRQFELKKKNQELEKFRFVLDYKIAELKRLIEPKNSEKMKLKKDESEMLRENENYLRQSMLMQLQFRSLEEKGKGLKLELGQHERRSEKLQYELTEIASDCSALQALIKTNEKEMKNTKQKKRELAMLVQQFYQKWILSYSDGDSANNQNDNGSSVVSSSAGQLTGLENRVSSALVKLRHDKLMARKEIQRRQTENIALTLRVNQLRKERKLTQDRKLHGGNESKSDGDGKGSDSEALIVASVMDQRRRERVAEEINYQQQEIRALKSRLADLTGKPVDNSNLFLANEEAKDQTSQFRSGALSVSVSIALSVE